MSNRKRHRVRTALRRGIVSSVLGIALGFAYGADAGAPPSQSDLLWTFTVDQCADDALEPEVQQVGGPESSPEQVSTAKDCDRKIERAVYQTPNLAGDDYSGAGGAIAYKFFESPFMLAGMSTPSETQSEPELENSDAPVEDGANTNANVVEQNGSITDVQIQALSGDRTIRFQYSRSQNCCADIELIPEQRQQVLEVRERDLAESGCRCHCPFTAEGVINNLEPGSYTLRVFTNQGSWQRQGSEDVWVEDEILLFSGEVILD
ncbi:MAG: hypothetical protein AAF889_04030 [Cyanobacteria bacterium P01_D01_bin.73]